MDKSYLSQPIDQVLWAFYFKQIDIDELGKFILSRLMQIEKERSLYKEKTLLYAVEFMRRKVNAGTKNEFDLINYIFDHLNGEGGDA